MFPNKFEVERNRSQPFYFSMKFGPPTSANQKPLWNMKLWPSKINQSHFSFPLCVFGYPNSPIKMVITIGLGQKYHIRVRIVFYMYSRANAFASDINKAVLVPAICKMVYSLSKCELTQHLHYLTSVHRIYLQSVHFKPSPQCV